MALLERLSIIGIRSFGLETPQRIEFFTPVTLILGQNGTGKTTIIECLKYSATGDLPPGSKSGCSFIHDPRVAQSNEVKAKVTLQIRDVNGCPTVVSRALVATQRDKTKQGTLKTLDGSIKRQLPDGRITSMSMRGNELDQEMVRSLGVSKAVLENVIFCHQEDSNWPLQEAKAVKQRFDDLFASSRYVKALDAIRKCKQDKDGNLKIYKTELKHLTRNRDDASKLRSEKEETRHMVAKQERILDTINTKLEPIVDLLNRYKEKYTDLTELQAELKSCESERRHLENMIENLKQNISEEFQGTDAELDLKINDAETELQEKQLHLIQSETTLQRARERLSGLETRKTELMIEQAKLDIEMKRQTDAVQSRDKLVRSIIELYNIPVKLSGKFNECNPSEVRQVCDQLNGLCNKSDNELRQIKQSSLNDEQLAQSDLDTARDELSKLKQKIEATKKQIAQTCQDMGSIKSRLKNESQLMINLDKLRKQLSEAESRVNQLNVNTDVEALRTQLTYSLTERRSIEDSITKLDEKISIAQQNSNYFRELESLQKERTNKFENIRKIRSRHSEALEQLFVDTAIPEILTEKSIEEQQFGTLDNIRGFMNHQARLRSCFITRLQELEQATKETRKRLAKVEQERSALETSTKFTRTSLQDKQNQLRLLEERLLNVAGSNNLEQVLEKLQERKTILENQCANEQGSLFLWQKFRDRLNHPDSDCPVCHRCLNDQLEREELLSELDHKISSMPKKCERKNQELQEISKRYDSLIELRPVNVEIETLRTNVIPELEARLNTELEKFRQLCNQRDQILGLLETYQADETLAKSIQGDLAVLERLENEAYELTVKVRRIKIERSSQEEEVSESLESLQDQRKSLRQNQLDLSEIIEQKQRDLDRHEQISRQAITEMHHLKDQIHKLEEENQANIRLKDDLLRLNELNARLHAELEQTESCELPVVQSRWSQANVERARIGKEREQKIEMATMKVNEFRECLRKLDEMCSLTNELSASQLSIQLNLIQNQLKTMETDLINLTATIETQQMNVEETKKQISEYKIRQRELTDCVQLRGLRVKLRSLIERTKKLIDKQKIISDSGQDLLGETKRLTVEEETLRTQKHDASNRLSELKAKLLYIENDLNGKYINADAEYLDMVYQLKTTELASTDLERYYRALDRAIMSYHAVKMADVNKIIKELWRSTYRGNDIDYIEICSEEEPIGGATTALISNANRTRRTYNYRVVMVKSVANNADTLDHKKTLSSRTFSAEARLDMRGRCSAGQKVLASLIIRLALAEVFCLHCGVLALDEPTTNLDRENIESLAFALVEIIRSRRQQKNFQLIVITHDEDFVELLGRSDYVENFFRLSRNIHGLSEISKVPIEEHFH